MKKTKFQMAKKWFLATLLAFISIGLLMTGCGQSAQQTPETRVIVDKTGREVTIPYKVEKVAPIIGPSLILHPL